MTREERKKTLREVDLLLTIALRNLEEGEDDPDLIERFYLDTTDAVIISAKKICELLEDEED